MTHSHTRAITSTKGNTMKRTLSDLLHARLRRVATVASAGVLAVGLAACSGADADTDNNSAKPDDSETRVLNVGQLGAAEVTKALLEAAGESDTEYDLSYSLYPAGGPAFMEAVPSGSVDLAAMADTPPIFAQVAGTPVKIVSVATTPVEGQSTVEILAPADSDLSSVEDLKGKKVATTQATILQYTLVRALEEAGLEYGDVEIVNLSPPDAVAAFQSGDVDALTALDPQLSQLKAGGAKVIGDGVGTTSGFTIFVATDDALESKEADVLDFIQRYQRAEAWAAENREEWTEIYADVTGLEPAIAAAVLERQEYTPIPIDESVISRQQEQADAYTELGLLPETLDVSEQFDDRFNDALFGE